MRYTRLIAASVVLLVTSAAPADDAPDKGAAQPAYIALGVSEAKADHAVRETREFFAKAENAWRQASQAAETARGHYDEALAKAVEAEGRKPDELRSQKTLDALTAQRSSAEQEWQKFANVTRPELEANYRAAADTAQGLSELVQNLTGVDKSLKDAKIDLAPLASLFDQVSAKADEVRAKGEEALTDLQAAQKEWESREQAAAHPAAP